MKNMALTAVRNLKFQKCQKHNTLRSVKNICLVVFFSVIIFFSCKNDLKLNAPYKEYPTIYAVLNPQDPIQIIRINKVFLGEGDANKMAQISDSINYPAGELTVTLDRYVGGVKSVATATNNPSGPKNTITFRDSLIEANPGAFNRTQRVYYTTDKLWTSGEYVLTVFNNKTKNTFTAKTTAINKVKPSGYSPLCPPYYPVPLDPANQNNPSVYIDFSNPGKTYSIRYIPNEAEIYQMTMRFHYYNVLVDGSREYLSVDYAFGNQNKRDAYLIGGLGPYLVTTFKASDVYDAVGNSLSRNSRPVSEIQGRQVYKTQFIIYCSTLDYADYLQFAAPSLSIAQDKPLYSNFEGKAALGIFAFRDSLSIEKEMDSDFISQFGQNHSTCPYKFYTYSGSLVPCNP